MIWPSEKCLQLIDLRCASVKENILEHVGQLPENGGTSSRTVFADDVPILYPKMSITRSIQIEYSLAARRSTYANCQCSELLHHSTRWHPGHWLALKRGEAWCDIDPHPEQIRILYPLKCSKSSRTVLMSLNQHVSRTIARWNTHYEHPIANHGLFGAVRFRCSFPGNTTCCAKYASSAIACSTVKNRKSSVLCTDTGKLFP